MMRCLLRTVCLAIPAALLSPGVPLPAQDSRPRPFVEERRQPLEYHGPGREQPDPKGLAEVRIGYFGPDDPCHPEGGDIWLAVNMAIDEANRSGGHQGLPFRVVPAWAEDPWSTGVSLVARMAYEQGVWAIIGGIDGPSTHLAEQVVAKARLTLVSPASTDRTANLANVPWLFSALPGDHLLAPAVAETMMRQVGNAPFAVLAATDHDSHRFLVEFEKRIARSGAAPVCRFEFRPDTGDRAELVRRVLAARPVGIVVIAGARPSARWVKDLRTSGFTGRIFGGPSMGRRAFGDELGGNDPAVFFPRVGIPSPEADSFAEAFRQYHGIHPDFVARYAYESARLLVAAVRKAGLNRARIRDAVRELSPWRGAAATIEWDPLGQNLRWLPGGVQR